MAFLMKVFPIGHFVFLIFEHQFVTDRTSITISTLFAYKKVITTIRVIFSFAVGLNANLQRKTVIELKVASTCNAIE